MTFRVPNLFGRRNGASVDSLPRIDSAADWSAISVRPGHHTVARTETVKFVIDLHDGNSTYFLNSKRWETHYAFVLRFINPRADYSLFLMQEYTREDRRFVLGSVMHYLDGDHWTIELDGSDSLAADRVAWMFDHISERMGAAHGLRFRPVSPSQASRVEALGDRLPVLSRGAINASVEYQPVVLGVAYGYLRHVRGTLDVSSVRPYDIVVTEFVPEEVPPVAALVTSEIQAPLAHVAVLSRNRNTPDMALRGAIDQEAFKRLEGQLVKLTVASQDYAIEPASRDHAEAAWASMRPAKALIPERDLSAVGLFDVAQLPEGAIRYVGAKAAQLGQLCGMQGIATPGGFALPFSAYAAHLDSAGLTCKIDSMLADPGFRGDAAVRAERLAQVRSEIVAHPVAPELLALIGARLRAASVAGGRFIFRSSTNAEDLEGFNGAGLYESTVVAADPTDAQIADALRFVWSSVWLRRAYKEREWYRIDHRAVAMAVLIQPFVERAVATGVAITGNPFKEGLRAVFINSQANGASVTGAIGNELPEQYLVATWAGEYEPELLSRSSLTQGAAILHDTDLRTLTDQLVRIHDAMLPVQAGSANAMDVEFALTAERQFIIVQARPYNIVYSLDRARPVPRDRSALERLMYRVRRFAHRWPQRTVVHRRLEVSGR